MNFTQYLALIESPVYKVKKKNKKKEKVKDQKNPPEEYEGYQVWGSNGMDGGYAIEDGPSIKEDTYEEKERARRRLEDAARTRKIQGGEPKKATPLKYGEFLKFDKTANKWVSNKE